jgi:hypothetical protein
MNEFDELLEAEFSILMALGIILLVIIALVVISTWIIFEKAGKPGWAAIIPFYSTVVWVQISGRPMWWAAVIIAGAFIPRIGNILNLAGAIYVGIGVAGKFGKSDVYGVLMGIFPFVLRPMLAFSDVQYEGETLEESDDLLDV